MEMHWRERLPNDGGELHHIYRPILNRESGTLYTDNKITFVGKKCFGLLFARPAHAVIKTLYHICLPISIPREIYLAVKKEAEAQKGKQRNIPLLILAGIIGCLKNFADIFCTPLYGVVLTLCALVGVILGLLHSEKIYDLRAIAGKIELSLLWGDKKSIWMLAPCFQETVNLKDLETSWGQVTHPNTNYEGLNPKEKAEANLTRAVFQHRRNHRAIAYCCKPWPKDVALDSATYRTC